MTFRLETNYQVSDEAREFSPHPNLLSAAIERQIDQKGPISFRDFMNDWNNGLTDKNGKFLPGYYSGNNAVIGDRNGELPYQEMDFITPSEISPFYGITFVFQLREIWKKIGEPKCFPVVEMGAGNGTLAHDILSNLNVAFSKEEAEEAKKFAEAIKYIIIEKSPIFIKRQRENLKSFEDKVKVIEDSAEDFSLPDINGVFLSIELPDTFPVSLVKKTKDGWKELYVGKGDKDKFERIWQEPALEVEEFLRRHSPEVEEEKTYPVNLAAEKWIRNMARMLKKGYIITIDYGVGDGNVGLFSSESKGIDTKSPDAYLNKDNVGRCDITVGVDFQALANSGKDEELINVGYVTQPGFLFGNSYDLLIKERKGFAVERPRDHHMRDTDPLSNYTWDVLIQSKNIPGKEDLWGTKFPVALDGYYSEKDAMRYDKRKIRL